VLYRNAYVPSGNILLFCDTLDARPDLARHVQSLFFMRGIRDHAKPSDYDRLYRLLRKLPNLREVKDELSDTCEYDIIDVGGADTYLLYKGLTCPLEMLHTRIRFSPLVMLDVLRSLPHLHDFSHYDRYEQNGDILAGTLSSCTALHVGPWFLRSLAPNTQLPSLRHLTFRWMNSDWENEEEFPAEIARVGQSLQSLCLYRRSNDAKDYVPMSSLLRLLAHATPNITILTLLDGFSFVRCLFLDITSICTDNVLKSPRDNMVIRETVIAKFRKLKVYIWVPDFVPENKLGNGGWDTDEEDGDVIDSDPDDDEPRCVKEERYVAKHFRGIPTLQYFVAGRDHMLHFYKRVAGGEKDAFRRNNGRTDHQCLADFLLDSPHYINPERPEDFLCYRVYDRNHLQPRAC
jgi:hypothetical protein